MLDLFSGRRDSLSPPRRMIFVGDGDFKKIGEEFLGYFIELGGLKPHEKVLDVGFGIGRMALPLAKYLDRNGRYEGFDIVRSGIDWCVKKITPRYPNFHFQLADIYNKRYNPKGRYAASEFSFPYEDGSFDFIFLTSVFTHMLPRDIEHYLSEISRVLKKGGRCLATFFLLTEESLSLIDRGKSALDFKHDFKMYRTISMDTPEAAVAYPEQFVLGLYEKYGLGIRRPIHYGSWCGRANFLSHQDIIIAKRRHP